MAASITLIYERNGDLSGRHAAYLWNFRREFMDYAIREMYALYIRLG